VGHVGHHVAPQLLCALEVLGHRVEGDGQFAEFVLGLHLDPLSEIAPAHAAGGLGQRVNRRENAARHEEGDHGRHSHAQQSTPKQVPVDGIGKGAHALVWRRRDALRRWSLSLRQDGHSAETHCAKRDGHRLFRHVKLGFFAGMHHAARVGDHQALLVD